MRASALERRWRHRVTLLLFVVAALVFGITYAIGHVERANAFERAMADDFRSIANITQVFAEDDVYVNIQPEQLGTFMAGGERFFQVWDAVTGELLDRSESLKALDVELPRPRPALVAGEETRVVHTKLPDGRSLSLLAARVHANWGLDVDVLQQLNQTISDRDVDLVVGRPAGELFSSLLPLATMCLLGTAAMPLLALLALRLGTRQFDSLVHRMVLQRERERGFLAHAAHELRTPLAEMRALADLAELEAEAGAPVKPVLDDLRSVADRMSGLLNALFRLARVQRGHEEPLQTLDLVALALTAVDGQAAAFAQRALQWDMNLPARLMTEAAPTLLRALLDNLVGNAIAHAPAGSVLRLKVEPGPRWLLTLTNDRAVDRDTAGHSDEHLGQGLLIAQLYAQAMDLTLQTQARGDSFEVSVRQGKHESTAASVDDTNDLG